MLKLQNAKMEQVLMKRYIGGEALELFQKVAHEKGANRVLVYTVGKTKYYRFDYSEVKGSSKRKSAMEFQTLQRQYVRGEFEGKTFEEVMRDRKVSNVGISEKFTAWYKEESQDTFVDGKLGKKRVFVPVESPGRLAGRVKTFNLTYNSKVGLHVREVGTVHV